MFKQNKILHPNIERDNKQQQVRLLSKERQGTNKKKYSGQKDHHLHIQDTMKLTLPNINTNVSSKVFKVYYYIINSLNNKDMIKCVLNSRRNWKEAESLLTTNYHLKITSSNKNTQYCLLNKPNVKMVNHFEYEMELCNKQNLFINIYNYCESININAFDFIPLTVLIRQGDVKLDSFSYLYNNISKYNGNNIQYENVFNPPSMDKLVSVTGIRTPPSSNILTIPKTHYDGKNIWLIKPPDLCKGKCINICDNLQSIEKSIKYYFGGVDVVKSIKVSRIAGGKVFIKYRPTTLLLQKYIERPLLYKGRKFDIRMWVLINHKLDVYLFKEGHLKTTSHSYDLNQMNKFIHLTNYSLQKQDRENFSKFEEGNEASFSDLRNELQDDKLFSSIMEQIIKIVRLSTQAIGTKINKRKREFCYVLLGYDFIVDSELKVWLLEINRNPGLSESSNLIKVLIPRLLHDTFKLTIDDLFPTELFRSFPVEGYRDDENLFLHINNLYSNIC